MSFPRDEDDVADEVFSPPHPTSAQEVGTQRYKQMPPLLPTTLSLKGFVSTATVSAFSML